MLNFERLVVLFFRFALAKEEVMAGAGGDGGRIVAEPSTAPQQSIGKLPEWASQPFDDCRRQLREITDVLHLARKGIVMVSELPKEIEWLMAVDNLLPNDDAEEPSKEEKVEHLEAAKRQADLANHEVERDFPLLHAQAVISLWTSLEALIKNFLAAWIENDSNARKTEALRKLKITLWEYEGMDAVERNLYTIDLLAREVSAPLKHGVSRFETLLDVFGLGGVVDEEVRKAMFEMSQVRNVLVHKRGLADRRLVEACPWLGRSIGEPVVVSHTNFASYFHFSLKYYFVLLNRVRARFNLSPHWPGDTAPLGA